MIPKGKTKSKQAEEVAKGRFPPCITYKIVYTSPEERRVKPAMMKVALDGADVPLIFSCRVKEELSELFTCIHVPAWYVHLR